MRSKLPTILLLLVSSVGSLATTAHYGDVASMEQKIRRIETNGRAARPDQTPTVFTESEVNAYLASDDIILPAGHAYGAGRIGYVHVDSVSLDGVEVPEFALQLFVEKYLTPKYPQIGIDSHFSLPDRLDTATVGLHKLAVTQK